MVAPEKSGWLVRDMNANSIIKKLNSVLQTKATNELRQSTKEIAQKLFDERKVADDYIEAFNFPVCQ